MFLRLKMVEFLVESVFAILIDKVVQSIALVVLVTLIGFLRYRKYARAQRRNKYPKDIVILHQFPPGLRAPSASPFALKLETW